MAASKQEIVEMLKRSYSMEIETVISYLAYSVNLDGVRAEEIKKSLSTDITEELGHARTLANRIKLLDGMVPGSRQIDIGHQAQPPADSTDVVAVIKAVIEAEEGAIEQYKKIIRATDGEDFVTQDMCIALLADEEEHRRLFVGFLKEYSK